MKFFSDLGSCFAAAGPPANQLPEEDTPAATTTSVRSRRQKSSTPQWQPALSVVTEDGVVAATEQPCRKKSTDKGHPRPPRTKPRGRSHGDNEFRNTAMPMIIPAISPTPFMF